MLVSSFVTTVSASLANTLGAVKRASAIVPVNTIDFFILVSPLN